MGAEEFARNSPGTIAGIRADPEIARGWYHGLRMLGNPVEGERDSGLKPNTILL
jgi:hypothetical protein